MTLPIDPGSTSGPYEDPSPAAYDDQTAYEPAPPPVAHDDAPATPIR